MASSSAERAPSFEELYQAIEALPPGLTGEILEPGVIRTMGRPGGPHRFAASRISRSLGGEDAADGGDWWFEQEAEIRFLGERLLVPDLAGWRVAQEAVPPAFIYLNPIAERPDWCCEVLSTSTEDVDRNLKVPIYASAGIEWLWLVDPLARRIEVLRVDDGKASLVETVEGDTRRRIAPFASFVDPGRWWLPPPANG